MVDQWDIKTYDQFSQATRPLAQDEPIQKGDLSWLDGMAIDWCVQSTPGNGTQLSAFQPVYGGYIALTVDDLEGNEVRRLL